MNRLGVRLMLSHLLVAVVGSVVTFLLVRLLAPPLFDESLRRAGRAGYGRGYGQVLRQEFASAVDTALAIGVLAGLVVAIVRLAIDQGRPVPLRADPDRIAQVVTNLVGNALRATPRGGTVRVGVRGEERSGSVVVADTGEGLAAADLERVFERFYRVGGRRGGESGTGIGLTISRGIAHAHGGTLTASSDGPGHGATFTLTLPR
ncbi:ATP-binding protein [Nigerium sp.]|uniref:sensor histidine kinase n=1 Tax=Nigerium sp. TaxID=2042655 RepID=UPI0032216D36